MYCGGYSRRGFGACRNGFRLLIVFVVIAFFVGCQTGGPPAMSLDEAKQVTAKFEGQSFVPPPRTIEDITEVLKQPEVTSQSNIARNTTEADASSPATSNPIALAKFYSRRGTAAREIGRDKQAIEDLSVALRHARQARSKELERGILMSLSTSELLSGNTADGIRHRKQILAISPSGGWRLTAYITLTWAYLKAGDVANAERAIESASRILPEISRRKDQTRVPLTRSNFFMEKGEIFLARGMFREAEKEFREALQIIDDSIADGAKANVRGSGGVTIGSLREAIKLTIISGLAQALMYQGKLSESEVEIRNGLDGALKQFGKTATHTAGVLAIFSEILSHQGRLDEAAIIARETVKIYGETGATPDSTRWAIARRVLAETLAANGKWEASLAEFEAIRRNLADADPQAFQGRFDGNVDWMLGLIKTGRGAEALDTLKRTLGQEVEKLGNDHFGISERQGLMAMAHAAMGNRKQALTLYLKASPNLLSHVLKSENQGGNQDWRRRLILETYLSLLADIPGTTIDVATEAFRIGGALSAQKVQRALSASGARAAVRVPELADLIRREQDTQKRIGALFGLLGNVFSQPADQRDTAVIASLRNQIEQLRGARMTLAEEIEGRFPAYAELVNPKPTMIEDARAVLRPGEALISTYVGEDRTYIWAVPYSGDVAFSSVDLGREDLADMVGLVRSALEPNAATLGDIPEFDLAAAHDLYGKLLEPVKAGWKDAGSLLVVAHGPLGYLPLSVLPTKSVELAPEDGALFATYRDVPWLARTHSVTVLPSVASLKTLRGLPPGNPGRKAFAGFGDPWFSEEQAAKAVQTAEVAALVEPGLATRGRPVHLRAAPDTTKLDSAELALLPRLLDTAEEIRSTALALKADLTTDVFLGPRANEHLVKTTNLSGYKVLAFATHGLVPGDLNGLTQPALALSAPEVAGVEGDGLLTMGEILGLKLDADWVVLSACNTGSGEGAGAEAVSGLGRAFFYAGTRALLVSNWPVETSSARTLTTDLFRRQVEDPLLTRAEALRQSMLALIDGPGFMDPKTNRTVFSYAHPIFWAPFTIVGDGGGTRPQS